MTENLSLIMTLTVGLGLAFVFGVLAHRLKLSPLVGYLVAGVAVGPFTPGFVADQALAAQLSEIGVILLMFGVGLHFAPKDLMAVRAVAVPGALLRIAVITLFGLGLARLLGWTLGAGLIFGLALSVASTVVFLRAMQERRMLETERSRIAVGWLIVEDVAMILVLVLLPALAEVLGGKAGAVTAAPMGLALLQPETVWGALGITVAKIAAFIALMLLVGRRVIPWLLHYVAHTGSRELFRLSVLAIALGVALGSAEIFGVSFALGAFFAGMVLAETQLSQQAAQETLPLRDAFAVLFFVAVGMLFNPMIVVEQPLALLATVAIIVVGKTLVAYYLVRALGQSRVTALTISAGLAQIGEFSFILASLGVSLAILPPEGRDLILAGAIISIVVNPLLFLAADRRERQLEARAAAAAPSLEPPPPRYVPTALSGHVVLVGHGRVGSLIGQELRGGGTPYLVVEENPDLAEAVRAGGVETVVGNVGTRGLIDSLGLERARWLVCAIHDPFEACNLVEKARKINPRLPIVARAHSDAEVAELKKFGADHVIMGEREIAREMTHFLFADKSESQI
ncbi:MAG: YbaL family putative K(+) efflux transporter [Rhodospirillaceae bacterium]|nr:YbaL family putative K(+) efflux transporter [Rhodospirillaceae bacterium]